MTQTSSSVPVKIVPETTASLVRPGEEYVYKKPELEFLKEYATCLDEDLAIAKVNVPQQRRSEILANPHVLEEMKKIQRAWRFGSRLTQGVAAGEHMRLMEKFEENYDKLETGNKPKMAGVLAKMSEANMKATGLIGAERDQAMPTVIVNMNMGAPEEVSVSVNQGGENNGGQG